MWSRLHPLTRSLRRWLPRSYNVARKHSQQRAHTRRFPTSTPVRPVCFACKASARFPGMSPQLLFSESMNLKGWLPVDAVVVDGRPGLQWLEMPDVDLREPFFQQTVERAKSDGAARGQLFTEFDVLLQLEKELESVPPTGFIFHSSRCGSTLVANACRAITNSIVLSEANAIDKLIARFITDVDNTV